MWFVTVATVALLTYLVVVTVPGLAVGRVVLRSWHAIVLWIAGWVALAWWLRRLAARERSAARLVDVGVASVSILFALLVADSVFAVWRNTRAADRSMDRVTYERESDPAIWHGELCPRIYHPTKLGFALYKPNVSLRGLTYGEYYEHRMLRSPLLRDSVLQYRSVGYRINAHGLRENAALGDARIFALGDSYVFGFATDEGAIWPDVLERLIGEPVYNLGVSATGPKQQVQLLEYMLRLHGDSMHIQQLLWMIFEGNDLEDSYAELREPPAAGGGRLDGTVLGVLVDLPRVVREQSVIHALLAGSVRFRARIHGDRQADGVVLRNPLYHSLRWGYHLFNPPDIMAATRDQAYVQHHSNTAAVAATIQEMKELSNRYGFRITVLLAPSDVRLYGASFAGLPALSKSPYFLDHVGRLASRAGFAVVDLSRLMVPYAEHELLYYRDDHHWNPRGNDVAARLIAGAVRF